MNQELVSISQESNIIVWDWESSSRVFQETFDGDLLISVSNGKLMAAATDSNEIIKLMKINSTWTTKKIKTEHKIYTLAVTDQYLITGDQSGHVNIYNSHLKLIKRLSVPDHRTVSHIALTEDSRYLVIGTTKGSCMTIFGHKTNLGGFHFRIEHSLIKSRTFHKR